LLAWVLCKSLQFSVSTIIIYDNSFLFFVFALVCLFDFILFIMNCVWFFCEWFWFWFMFEGVHCIWLCFQIGQKLCWRSTHGCVNFGVLCQLLCNLVFVADFSIGFVTKCFWCQNAIGGIFVSSWRIHPTHILQFLIFV
jgi:hypothetical protein